MSKPVIELLTLTRPNTAEATPLDWACNSHVVLYGELLNGQRMPGGPKLHYMDHIRRILNKSNIPISGLEKLTTDRDTWRSACASGLSTLCQVSDQAAADRAPAGTTGATQQQLVPDVRSAAECASEFGLRSHLRSHISRPSQRS